MDILDKRQDTLSSDFVRRRAYVPPMHWTEKLSREINRRDITLKDVAVGAGIDYDTLAKQMQRRTDNPRGRTIEKLTNFLGRTLIDSADTSINTQFRKLTNILELDVRAEGGAGLEAPDCEQIINEWSLPTELLTAQTSAPAKALRIITVIGNSMEPDFRPGERVLVDTDDRSPSPAGAFALWDGFGLVIKYVEVIPGSDPVMVRLISRNSVFETYERPAEDIHINGRIIGKWLWT